MTTPSERGTWVRVHVYGHACVGLQAGGKRLVIDPYEPNGFDGQMRYPALTELFDFSVSSHDHLDHSGHSFLEGAPEVVHAGSHGPFRILRHSCAHDEYGGRRKGGLIDMIEVRVGTVRILHASDVGHSPPAEIVSLFRGIDLLLVPIGGNFTIGAAQAWEWIHRLRPTRVVPIHFQTVACDLPLLPLSLFQTYFPATPTTTSEFLDLTETEKSNSTTVVYLREAHSPNA